MRICPPKSHWLLNLTQPGAVLAIFWSGSCHIMAPVLESLVGIYGRAINFHKVDIEDSPEITRQYGVREVPTFLIFNKGSLVDFAVGAMSRSDLASKLEKVLEA